MLMGEMHQQKVVVFGSSAFSYVKLLSKSPQQQLGIRAFHLVQCFSSACMSFATDPPPSALRAEVISHSPLAAASSRSFTSAQKVSWTKVQEEPSGKSVAPRDVNGPAKNGDLRPNSKVIGSNIRQPISTQDFLSFQESTLGNTRILHLGLVHADGSILHVVHDRNMPVAGVLIRPFNH